MNRVAGVLTLALITPLFAACGYVAQDTSGRAYLAKYDLASASAVRPGPAGRTLRPDIRRAANVEPILRFPARIGLARIENGRLTGIPPKEADAWLAMGKRLGRAYGTFVPISPFIAAPVAMDTAGKTTRHDLSRVERVLRRIRLGAARQHVDAVLVYEIAYSGENRITPLSVADLSIIGLFLAPSRWIRGKGLATALLMDVRNGYPYGTASATSREGTLTTNAGSSSVKGRIARLAGTQAVVNLVPQVEKLARTVKAQAALRRPGPAKPSQRVN